MKKKRLIIDGHVHIYDCYNLDHFFSHGVQNLEHFYEALYSNGSPFELILLLTEAKENDFFNHFKEIGSYNGGDKYRFVPTKEDESLELVKNGKRLCYLIRGRQIVTKEDLEVLHIGSKDTLLDGLPINEVVDIILEKKNIAVLAWGFGKWWFKRGKIIRNQIERFQHPLVLMGDNSGRPIFLPFPQLFKLAKKLNYSIINGSDSLPFKGEEYKVGSYGFSVEGEFVEDEPAKSLRDILTTDNPNINYFGKRDNMINFFRRQLKIYSKKYFNIG